MIMQQINAYGQHSLFSSLAGWAVPSSRSREARRHQHGTITHRSWCRLLRKKLGKIGLKCSYKHMIMHTCDVMHPLFSKLGMIWLPLTSSWYPRVQGWCDTSQYNRQRRLLWSPRTPPNRLRCPWISPYHAHLLCGCPLRLPVWFQRVCVASGAVPAFLSLRPFLPLGHSHRTCFPFLVGTRRCYRSTRSQEPTFCWFIRWFSWRRFGVSWDDDDSQ